MNYGRRFMTLYRRQGSRPSPWKRNAKKQNGCLRRAYIMYTYMQYCLSVLQNEDNCHHNVVIQTILGNTMSTTVSSCISLVHTIWNDSTVFLWSHCLEFRFSVQKTLSVAAQFCLYWLLKWLLLILYLDLLWPKILSGNLLYKLRHFSSKPTIICWGSSLNKMLCLAL